MTPQEHAANLVDKFPSSEDRKVVEEIWKKYFPKNSVIGFR